MESFRRNRYNMVSSVVQILWGTLCQANCRLRQLSPPVILRMLWSLNRVIKICCPCKIHLLCFKKKKKKSIFWVGTGSTEFIYHSEVLILFRVILWGARSWTVRTYWVPSNLGYSVILHTRFPKLRRKKTHSSTLVRTASQLVILIYAFSELCLQTAQKSASISVASWLWAAEQIDRFCLVFILLRTAAQETKLSMLTLGLPVLSWFAAYSGAEFISISTRNLIFIVFLVFCLFFKQKFSSCSWMARDLSFLKKMWTWVRSGRTEEEKGRTSASKSWRVIQFIWTQSVASSTL